MSRGPRRARPRNVGAAAHHGRLLPRDAERRGSGRRGGPRARPRGVVPVRALPRGLPRRSRRRAARPQLARRVRRVGLSPVGAPASAAPLDVTPRPRAQTQRRQREARQSDLRLRCRIVGPTVARRRPGLLARGRRDRRGEPRPRLRTQMKRWNIVGCSSVRSRDASRRLGRARGNAKPNPDSILRSITCANEREALNLSRASIRYYHRTEGDRAGNVGPGRRILRTLGATLFTREVSWPASAMF